MCEIKSSDKTTIKTLPDIDGIRLQADDLSKLKHVTLFFPADKAELKLEGRISGSCQRGTMETISELNSGLTMEPEDTFLDWKETRKRRCGRCPFRELKNK